MVALPRKEDSVAQYMVALPKGVDSVAQYMALSKCVVALLIALHHTVKCAIHHYKFTVSTVTGDSVYGLDFAEREYL
jgi:hypothetical protein